MEELKCDVSCALQNGDFTILQTVMSQCYNLRAEIAAKIEEANAYEIECAEKKFLRARKISELQEEIEKLKAEIDAAKLEQKITDKKILNTVKQEEKLKQEVDSAISERDSLSLEIVDLQQESERRKEYKRARWSAFKRACYIYTKNLDLSIHLNKNTSEGEYVKITFFPSISQDSYKTYLVRQNNKWRVEEIQPVLKKEYLSEFKGIVNFSKQTEIFDITAFLCCLRQIFTKYYLNKT